MIGRIDVEKTLQLQPNKECLFVSVATILNELVDIVNKLHEEAENNARIRADHEKLIDTLVAENNIHEKQIDELQMKTEPEKCEIPTDPYAEQRKWIGKLCWIWDDDGDERTFAKLTEIIEDDDDRPFKCFIRWKHCEPVKPDDDIIFKGEQ